MEEQRPWKCPCPSGASQPPALAGGVLASLLVGRSPLVPLSAVGICYTSPSGSRLASELHGASMAGPVNKPMLSFSFHSQTGIISLYDCVFKKNPGYNQKLHRDDREHAKSLGLYVNKEVRLRQDINKGLTVSACVLISYCVQGCL